MVFSIRRAGPADLDTIADYNDRLARESEGKSLDRSVLDRGVEAVLADPNRGLYFVAEQDGRIIGQLMVTTEWSDWRNGWLWWIQSVYVHADARRSGVFRALFEHVAMVAKERGDIAGLRLYVEEHNTAARAVYARMGMEAGYLVLERCPL